jgi:hypothetical protein
MHMKNQTSNENVDINSPKTGLKKAIKSSTFSSMFLPRGLIIAPKKFLTDDNRSECPTKISFLSMPALSLHKKARLRASIIVSALIMDEEEEIDHQRYSRLVNDYIRHKVNLSKCRSRVAKMRKKKKRLSWSVFEASLTDTQFRRMYRMSRDCFGKLCMLIEEKVGEEKFKSECYLRRIASENTTLGRMANANEATTSGFISGEVKLAITLRMLAGGSYLDLFLIYDVFETYAYTILHETVADWICNDEIIPINGKKYLNDMIHMKDVAKGFEEKCRCGAFRGCIGALDGWLVKIKRPGSKDNVTNPGDFFSRKGFYAINCQVIVDRYKRVIYKSIICHGAEHDSSAFKASDIYDILHEQRQTLEAEGLYFIADSAYALRSFLITPYDNAIHGEFNDNFNFYHSSSRIVVECAFGEIDMRWGIFWKPLKFSLVRNARVIDACLRLHNFIVDYRLQNSGNGVSDHHLSELNMHREDIARARAEDPNGAHGVYGGEAERRFEVRRGRPLLQETEANNAGKQTRDGIRDEISMGSWVRPSSNWYREDNRTIMNS